MLNKPVLESAKQISNLWHKENSYKILIKGKYWLICNCGEIYYLKANKKDWVARLF